MAVAKERVPEQRGLERVPHKTVAYAFLELEVKGNVEEFLAYRAELLEKHPEYGFAAEPSKAPAKRAAKTVEVAEQEQVVEPVAEAAAPAGTPATSASTDAPKSARDIAREKILAKRKGA